MRIKSPGCRVTANSEAVRGMITSGCSFHALRRYCRDIERLSDLMKVIDVTLASTAFMGKHPRPERGSRGRKAWREERLARTEFGDMGHKLRDAIDQVAHLPRGQVHTASKGSDIERYKC